MAGMQWLAEPINRDIVLFLGNISPEEQSRAFATLAREQIDDAKRFNLRVLGIEPPSRTYVDGLLGVPLEQVKPNGVIFTEFELLVDVLAYISAMLHAFSPVRSGRYERGHRLLVDGIAMDIDTPALLAQIRGGEEFVFVNVVPYARKIEQGSSQMAPNGVYEAVAMLARRRFGRIAKIQFNYRTTLGGITKEKSLRQPAIIVRMF